MLGRANHVFYQFPKSRLRQPINDTVLCGDPEERVRTGAGRKWIAWNADKHKTASHKALIAPPMSRGGCTLYAGDAEEHLEFAQQICNERLVAIQNRQDGKEVYQYQIREPHDFGDALAQAYALAAS